jgi:hypothetical protein
MTDNPQAFPCFLHPDSRDGQDLVGMTLRDYFAGQALVGIFSDPARANRRDMTDSSVVAFHAYAFADAMLTERTKHNDQYNREV